MSWLAKAYVRRKKLEGSIGLAAMGEAVQEAKQERIAPEAMMAMMGGF